MTVSISPLDNNQIEILDYNQEENWKEKFAVVE